MSKTRLISPGSIPNHRLLKNLQLSDNFVSNDGDYEGLSINDSGEIRLGSSSNTLRFDSLTDVVVPGDITELDGASALSISIWVKFDRLPSDHTLGGDKGYNLCSKGNYNDAASSWFFALEHNHRLAYSIANEGAGYYDLDNISPAIRANEWYNLAVSINIATNTAKLYFNGVSKSFSPVVAFSNASYTIANTSKELKIGTQNVGCINDVAVWNDDLDDAAMTEIYNSGIPFDLRNNKGDYDEYTDNLKGYWRLDEGTGSTAEDLSASGNDGTITNTVWATDGVPQASISASGTGTRLYENLSLNDQYISNDGGDEGISVTDAGLVTVSGDLDIASNMTIADNEIDISSGDFLLDVAGDITLDAAGGDVNILQAELNMPNDGKITFGGPLAFIEGSTYALNFQVSAGPTTFKNIQSNADADNVVIDNNSSYTGAGTSTALFIDYDDTGGTTISNTLTNIALDIDLTSTATKYGSCNNYGIDMDIVAGTSGTQYSYGMDISVTGADANYGINVLSSHRQLLLSYDGGSNLSITVADDSHTTLATAESGNLILDAAGDITLDAAGGDVNVLQADLTIPASKKLYLDGGGDTHIAETSADAMTITVGNDKLMVLTEGGDDGNQVHFKTASVGFTKIAETFNDDPIIGSGETNDTHIDFRHTNKISLAVTGNITNLNLIFPPVSGNFLLLLTYDGDHTITNYKVYEYDESAADGSADVLWPGGTKPDNTASGVDILSFFYDGTSGADKCYGVASLAFATP